jgi:predicted aldo/keto reductase-like oxidoreductase
MIYRDMAGLEVSILGMGAMRLPMEHDGKTIDEKRTEGMIRRAVELGINYFDTAAPYHEGRSEVVLGNVLSGGLRDKVILATKQPCWLVQRYEDFDALLEEQLGKLKTDYIDFYLLHALFTDRWESVRRLDVLGWLEKKKAEGKIRRFGFSFHDTLDVFKTIVDGYGAWEMCQIQYNYMDESFQAGTAGLRYAVSKNLPVAVMEPLRGGLLASPPPRIRSVFERAGLDPVETALRWLWDKPEVSIVLSGMSSVEQLERNAETAGRTERAVFTEAEKSAVAGARALYEELAPIPCTQCRYCMPCPSGVFIPDILALYNKSIVFGSIDSGKVQYVYHTPDENKASACTGCGACEIKCPQRIEVSDWMPKIHAAFMAGGS